MDDYERGCCRGYEDGSVGLPKGVFDEPDEFMDGYHDGYEEGIRDEWGRRRRTQPRAGAKGKGDKRGFIQ